MTTPGAEYSQRLEHRRAEERRWNQVDARVAYARLALFGAAAVLLVLAIRGQASPWLIAAPVVLFAVLLQVHDGVFRRRTAAQRAIAH